MPVFRKLVGFGVVGVAGAFGGLAMMPTLGNRDPTCPTSPLFKAAIEAVDAANAAAFDAPPVTSRARGLQQLERSAGKGGDDFSEAFDLLVVGGGATGSAVALDAAARGMRVALVERGDFACETSSKSTKLIHGGVRYLEKAIFGLNLKQLSLVFEALGERTTLLRQAPHLCHELATVIPCYSRSEAGFYWAGMKAYDLLAALGGSTLMGGSRFADIPETLGMAPHLRRTIGTELNRRDLAGSIVYYDGSMDDARLNLSAALTACAVGAAVVNHCSAVAIKPDVRRGDDGRRQPPRNVVTVRDEVTGKTIDVKSKFVVCAAGPFTDQVKNLIQNPSDEQGGSAPPEKKKKGVIMSAGAHVTLPAYVTEPGSPVAERAAVLVPRTKDGRVLFIAPWGGATIAGTTDREVDVPDEPQATEDDLDFIVSSVRDALESDVTRANVLSQWCGIRPLAPGDDDDTATGTQNVVREHAIHVAPTGVCTVVGGKWTTYRKIGTEVVDALLYSKADPEWSTWYGKKNHESISAFLPLVGATKWFDDKGTVAATRTFWRRCEALRSALDEPAKLHLWRSYGVRATAVLEGAMDLEKKGAFDKLPVPAAKGVVPRAAPAGTLDRLVPGHPVLSAEVVHAVRHEMCLAPEDFICRRTRLAFLDAAAALAAVDKVTAIMAKELKWPADKAAKEAARAKEKISRFVPPAKAHPTTVANERTRMFSEGSAAITA
eukprot:CAMPEP_0174830062 /NCGR_PEP_ID=MMETSP1114-20130205/2317_1 /TAXON_ID=312471 /ORGANISM="Neobodo designis, Strain CCAP 1951/1" /LENGTH=718 /DNA_ID=CAMNT_0016063845 /DNA_START=47 /DNA_END=2203 /DNA_ORIENTATION=-